MIRFQKSRKRAEPAEEQPTHPLVRWRRAAYRAVQNKPRALALTGVLPVAVDRETFETHAGNAWFSLETGLVGRAVTYGMKELATAGLIESCASGPRRRIRLLIPDAELQPAYDMRATRQSLPAHSMRAIADTLPAYGRQKARIRYADIGARSSPKAPKTQLEMSAALAAQRERQPFVRGAKPSWLDDEGEGVVASGIHAPALSPLSNPDASERPAPEGRPSLSDDPDDDLETPARIALSVLKKAGGELDADIWGELVAQQLVEIGWWDRGTEAQQLQDVTDTLLDAGRMTLEREFAGDVVRLQQPQTA